MVISTVLTIFAFLLVSNVEAQITECNLPDPQGSSTTANCTFEGSDVCGFSQDLSDNFDWARNQLSTPVHGISPQHDHTFEAFAGHYMYIDVGLPSANDVARLNSYNLTGPITPSCVTFWYNMYGSGIGTLNVHVLRDGIRGSPILTLPGSQDYSWKVAKIPLATASSNTSYQIVFEASRGTNQGRIAIDDFSVTEGSCSQSQPTVAYMCTFDSNLCGFSQDNSDDFHWTRNDVATLTPETGPEYDHTIGRPVVGSYMYLLASNEARDVGRLNSNILTGSITRTCVTFWYHMHGPANGTLNVYVLRDGSRGSPIWTFSGNTDKSWDIGKVTLTAVPCNTPYQIVFEANRPNRTVVNIAIDDFSVTPGACSPDGCNLPSFSDPTANCTFEGCDVFSFPDRTSKVQWRRHKLSTQSSGTRPQHDPTLEDFIGHYMNIEVGLQSANDVARLNSYILNGPITPTCVTFWYRMYGSGIATLNVYVLRNGSRESSILTLSGNQGYSWNVANVSLKTVSSNTSYQIVFEAIRRGSRGDIAIDDFSVTEGSCSQSQPTVADMCTFDHNMCGFSQDNSDDFDWTRKALPTSILNKGPEYDHTFGQAVVGTYKYIEVSSKTRNGVSRMNSDLLTGPITPTCVTFWYHMYGSAIGTLDVYVLRYGTRESPIWTLSGHQGKSWNIAKVTLNAVPCDTQYQIVFEAKRSNGIIGDIAIDDFSVTPGICSPDECNLPVAQGSVTIANCTFEGSDVCGFSQDLSDNFDWTLHQSSNLSSGTRPQHDHTLEDFIGHYMYIEVGLQSANDVARLNSYILTGQTTPKCVTFWYHMYGSAIGTLNVYVLRDGSRSPIWTMSGNQGNSWIIANVNLNAVPCGTPYQIVFEANCGNGTEGGIAIDDFSVTPGNCSPDAIKGWSNWADNGTCSTTCGPGSQMQSRTRTCTGSCPSDFTSVEMRTVACMHVCACPSITEWSDWANIGTCSKTCGLGSQMLSRTRTCTGSCPSDFTPVETRTKLCLGHCARPSITGWSNWADYGTCSTTFGPGSQMQTRTQTCTNCPSNLTPPVETRTVACMHLCACPSITEWSEWADNGTCSTTSGTGSQMQSRTRTCTGSCPSDFTPVETRTVACMHHCACPCK